MNHIVIMAGGVGSRLAPLSTPEHPKQFLDLLSTGRTLIRMTYERFLEADPQASVWVVTGERYLHFVQEQLPEVPLEQVLLEPVARNTAPCIAYACRRIRQMDPAAVVVVTPSDAYVPDTAAFASTIREALAFASTHDSVACVGITPDGPSPLYGYIKAGEPVPGTGVSRVHMFKEKPSVQVAEGYLAEGGYSWNAGIFVWRADVMEGELRRYVPELSCLMDALEPSMGTGAEALSLREIFPQCPSISIDYAVMERTALSCVIPYGGFWSDLGSFDAIDAVKARISGVL